MGREAQKQQPRRRAEPAWARGVRGGGEEVRDRERQVPAPAGSVPSRGTPPAAGATQFDVSLPAMRRQQGHERGTVWLAWSSHKGVLGTPAGRGR